MGKWLTINKYEKEHLTLIFLPSLPQREHVLEWEG